MRAMGNKFKMVNCNSNNVTNVTNRCLSLTLDLLKAVNITDCIPLLTAVFIVCIVNRRIFAADSRKNERKRGLTPEETRRDSTGFDKKDVRKTTET